MGPKRTRGNASAPAVAGSSWGKLTVAQLKQECTKRGLSDTGKKQELIDRLEDWNENGPPVKTVKQEDSFVQAVQKLKSEAESSVKKKIKKDTSCNFHGTVYEDYAFMLNQTNVGGNNNKFYVGQLLSDGSTYVTFFRWGRVGEPGTSQTYYHSCLDLAVKDFAKKFHDKTKNKWENRDSFCAYAGKYTLLSMEGEEEAEVDKQTSVGQSTSKGIGKAALSPCTLDPVTQDLLNLIFSHDMFRQSMEQMNLDLKRMPLGMLSKAQIAKGMEALIALEKALQSKKGTAKSDNITTLTSEFYTLIPHAFGRTRPPLLDTQELLDVKKQMLMELSDIELAQDIQKKADEVINSQHPLDIKYGLLKCHMKLLDENSEAYKVILQYMKATGTSTLRLSNVWELDRSHESERFAPFNEVLPHKLLWHGTSVAVVAAILQAGLRIMPHSGGRVGRGIYFASEQSKSEGYVRSARHKNKNYTLMFLAQVALGKQQFIKEDHFSLEEAPPGFDSVVARGQREPDPAKDVTLMIDDIPVTVPQGNPKPVPKYKDSNFDQSEYLVYQESQVRLRYLLQFTD